MSTLFRIHCDTCQATLKVSDRSAIGQALACPRCKSMLTVTPPADWIDVGDSLTDSSNNALKSADSEPDESAFEDIDAVLNQVQRKQAAQAKRHTPGTVSPPAKVEADSQRSSTVSAAHQQVDAGKAGEASHDPLLPSDAWTSAAAKARQRMLLLYGGSALGLLLALGLIIGMILQFVGGDQVADVANGDPQQSTQLTNDSLTDPEENKLDDPLEKGAADLTDSNPDKQSDPPDSSRTEHPVPVDPQIATNDTDTQGEPPKENRPNGFDVPKVVDEEAPGFLKPRVTDPPAADEGIGDAAMEGLAKLSAFLDTSPFDLALEGEMPKADLTGDFARDIPLIEKPSEIKNLNVERNVTNAIAGIAFDKHALIKAVTTLQKLTDVPITFDPESMRRSGLRWEQEITATIVDTNARDALNKIVTPFDLSVTTSKNGLFVSRKSSNTFSERTYDLSSLLAGTTDRTNELTKLLELFVDPASWEKSGGEGRIAVSGKSMQIFQTPANHAQIDELLAQLRVAFLGEMPGEISLDPRHRAALESLKPISKVEFIQPRKLSKLVELISREHALTLLVDWESLNEIGWNINTEVPFSAPEEKLYDSLQRMLRAMKLAMIAFDADLFVITTPELALQYTNTEIYLLDDFVNDHDSARKLAGQIQQLVAAELATNPQTGFYLTGEAPYFLIARVSQPRQIAIDGYLKGIRKSLTAVGKSGAVDSTVTEPALLKPGIKPVEIDPAKR
jgi:hypothetical protein